MKVFSLIASIIATGTHDDLTDEKKQRIRINNALCLTTGVLAIVFGFIFWLITHKLQILIPAIIEGLGFFFIIYLNHLKKHETAGICMISYHAMCVVYFGVLLGTQVEVVLALLFMISATYLVFNKRKSILICFCITLGGLFVTEFFYYSNIIKPIEFSHNVTFFIRWVCIAFILTINTVCILFYKNTANSLLAALKERSKELEKANKSRKIFLQETSHEIRNPLNAIFGIVQLMRLDLKNGRSEESLPALVDNLYVATFNVKDIINNVLELSRIEAGQLDAVNRKHVHIRHLLQGITGVYEYVAITKAVEIKLTFTDMPDLVFTDDTKLSQIVNNLLLNAIKYTRNQSVITIDCGVREDKWYISITDQGGGVESDKLKTIYHSLEADRSSFMEGTGLGLHISRHFAELLDGGITVDTLAGISTTFTVAFPAKDIVSRHTPAPLRSAPIPRQFAGKIILVVEDDKMNQAILRNFLQNNGATVALANNGVEGLDLARQETPHLIILDSHMPKMNGREMLYHLKQDEELRNIPVIIASGDAFTETADLFIREGAADYVIKPIEFTALRQLLDKHLNSTMLVNHTAE
ncbi:hybrid sensor histidine kinase/response regulator [Chitinophaga barathri]|uniref:histidine kinase n=1 Tax=Chitinophaga barathri TaxID=1647451 RepID=A0A3N4M5P4_9BACT|nr:response regulator [Chitinophaga barathri]RPD38624.1 response regulator [Chitinophaga barathri]